MSRNPKSQGLNRDTIFELICDPGSDGDVPNCDQSDSDL
jgi:hypothetical protein